ncbi:MAG: hypothetical protein NUV77_26105 [Thermoguttaceae bacterium]|nr:hypothetical protein [Thermoguttaceae bacterium]
MFCLRWFLGAALCLGAGNAVLGGELRLLAKPHDPYGSPRPARGQENVPLLTTFYVELGVDQGGGSDAVLPESVGIELEPEGQPALAVLRPGRQAADGYRASFMPGKDPKRGASLIVYVDSRRRLLPSTRYTIRVSARSREGASLPAGAGTWQFTTEAAPKTHPLRFDLSLDAPAVRWHGGFFTGFCSPGFCTSAANRVPTYRLMEEVRKTAPRAWSLQRDFWLTGMEHQPAFLSGNLPNVVRERETRRIAAMEKHPDGVLLRVEDFFGHPQYGIPSDRPPSADYHPGDEVLIADGVHDARAKVVRTDDRQRTVLVTAFDTPAGGWKIAYAGPLNRTEDPNAPGLFPPGGCYLRKFRPSGTPMYYWGRLDREWDLAHRQFQRRLMPNFADAPGDLAIDGRNWTTAKDYVELHEATRAITSHIIRRYGDAALTFPWSVFNEPDLIGHFWRSDWNELQKFYDYTVDAILRAFEDHGYDSQRVFVGGLELGGIFGTNLRLREFLAPLLAAGSGPGCPSGERRVCRPAIGGKAVEAGRATLPDPRRARLAVRLHLGPRVQPFPAHGGQADPSQGNGPGDRPRVLRPAVGQFARVVPRVGLPARPRLRRQLPGQRLLPDLVRRRGAPAVDPGRQGPAIRLRRVDPHVLALAEPEFRGPQRLRPGHRGRR